MAHPPASAPSAPSKKRKHSPTTSTIPNPTTTTTAPRTGAPTAAHFARLSALWALDRRIPSPASRAAWAAARGLDAEKVHKWWYRCRARAKKMGVEVPEGSYEMEVGDVEGEEEEEERKAREEREEKGEKARSRRVKVKEEEEEEEEQVEGVQMSKVEEEEQEETQGQDTPSAVGFVQVEDCQQIQTGVDDAVGAPTHTHRSPAIPNASAVTGTPSPPLPPSPRPTSSPLTLSQCFLPPSSPYTSPPPRSAPCPPTLPPPVPDLPRLTRASKRLRPYMNALEYVPASDSTKPTHIDDDGKRTLTREASAVSSAPVHPPTARRASQIANIPRAFRALVFSSPPLLPPTCAFLSVGPTPARRKEVEGPSRRPTKKTTITAPKHSNPSRKRLNPPRLLPQTASHSSLSTLPPPPPLSPASSRPLADTDDPIPTPADLERALYEGITFTPCFDISLSTVPYLFGDACAFQFSGVSGSLFLGSELGATSAARSADTGTGVTARDGFAASTAEVDDADGFSTNARGAHTHAHAHA
ncbi:hypothetical protein D9611_012332 [Ephemerocybe angulata]|uniref:Uncharacterized protein n=1 Tax=Ephemerocybe angulata TaxID=980116 RepID=A0A8H5CE04_9AGAR|nr:hypothetical protein D9611_012332 [Tulosesus angulatus]